MFITVIFSHVKKAVLLLSVVLLQIQLPAQQVDSIEIHSSEKFSFGEKCLLGFVNDSTLSIISNGIHYRLNTRTGNLSPVDLSEMVTETQALFKTLFPEWETAHISIEPTIKAAGLNMCLGSPWVLYHRIFYNLRAENNYEMKLFSFIKSDSIEFLWSDTYADLGAGIASGENYFFRNDTIILIGTSLFNTGSDNSSYHLLKLQKSGKGFTISDTIEFPVDIEKIKWTETDDGLRYSDPDFRFFDTQEALYISQDNHIYSYTGTIRKTIETKNSVIAFSIKENKVYTVEIGLNQNFLLRKYLLPENKFISEKKIDSDEISSVIFHENSIYYISQIGSGLFLNRQHFIQ